MNNATVRIKGFEKIMVRRVENVHLREYRNKDRHNCLALLYKQRGVNVVKIVGLVLLPWTRDNE